MFLFTQLKSVGLKTLLNHIDSYGPKKKKKNMRVSSDDISQFWLNYRFKKCKDEQIQICTVC